ncbi:MULTISPECIES: LysE family translocator [Agrobacterium]|jgi:threonine/homoserine/homoserine lactone efflux protein|uniref:LysE family translocator n=4 Tax=Agrobacterium tumefaciens complex TaxID=1183400 RepID=A0AAP4YTR1_AGRTU|nr:MULTISPECIES: LysE family translocator [Agrobacterium]MCP2133550.1 threonine/homoserine/homoserine lactone efflux protein [Rhizobium sp. SLBN-94]TGE77938.1 LysE family translocator [Rhizobium sp. SEMIA 439]AYM06565.1 RhtB family transporter [Agrobacterium tumefaciens]AYM82306.1 RhtB family transporter [Agrobacterium tumefaciens]EHH06461.1 RhtB family transporter [Agrobacterium tumefaciens CCNWGS0286]
MDFVPSLPTLIAFTIAILLLAVTPGPDMTLWISRSLREGRAAGFMTLVGTNIGITVHTMLVAFGVAALIVASPTAFMILKTGGAAYLVWLAIQAIRKGSDFVMVKSTGERAQASLKSALLNGIWVNLLNPKVIIFFMTFLPQFVSASDPHVTGKLIFLGIWSIIVALPIGIGIVVAADVLSAWLQRNRKVLRGLDYTIAGVFSIFAVKIFFTQTR